MLTNDFRSEVITWVSLGRPGNPRRKFLYLTRRVMWQSRVGVFLSRLWPGIRASRLRFGTRKNARNFAWLSSEASNSSNIT